MPENLNVELYTINELPDAAKAKAREEFITDVLNDSAWHEVVYDDLEAIAGTLGITIARTPTENERDNPAAGQRCIWFKGFSSQGDGACFEGRWTHTPDTGKRIREHAPLDEILHQIADTLATLQTRNLKELTAVITTEGNDMNDGAMHAEVRRENTRTEDPTEDALKTVTEEMRRLARWLYAELEKEWNSASSDGEVDEAIQRERWRFTAAGAHYDET